MTTSKKDKKSEKVSKPAAQEKAKPAPSAAGDSDKAKTSTKKAKFENPKDDPA